MFDATLRRVSRPYLTILFRTLSFSQSFAISYASEARLFPGTMTDENDTKETAGCNT